MRKRIINSTVLGLCSLSMTTLIMSSCSPQTALTVDQSQLSVTQTPTKLNQIAKATKRLHFRVNLSSPRFNTKQTAEPEFAKLEIEGAGGTIYAVNADANGFVPLGDGIVSADVPEGSNLTAELGLYTSAEPSNLPIVEVGNVFHISDSETPQEVTLSGDGLVIVDLVNELRAMGSNTLDTPINIADYNAFAENLSAQLDTNQNTETLNLNQLAQSIDSGSLIPNATTGSSTEVDTLFQYEHEATYISSQNRAGVQHVLPINQFNKTIYMMDSSKGTDFSLYGVNIDPASITSDAFGNKKYAEIFRTSALRMPTISLTLGKTNVNLPTALGDNLPSTTTKNASAPVIFSLRVSPSAATKYILEARKQTDGSLAWSYDFGDGTFSSLLNNFYIPVLKRVKQSCLCEDEDLIMAAFSGVSAQDANSGIHAVKSGVKQWFYQYVSPSTSKPVIFQNGALSSNRSALYNIANDTSGNVFLISLKTSPASPPTGEQNWVTPITGSLPLKSALALGTDGTIYLMMNKSSKAHLQAYDPSTGGLKWEKQLNAATPTATSPIVDRQDGQDVIFVADVSGAVYAYYADGTSKWTSPVQLESGYSSYFAPVIGEEPNGRHVLYVPTYKALTPVLNTHKIVSIADQGSSGRIEWSTTPWSSFLLAGFTLFNSRLYFTTFDGGEGQFSQLQGIKVSATKMPTNAPWPKIYGSLRQNGNSFASSRSDDYLP